jgi:hypothetical protein
MTSVRAAVTAGRSVTSGSVKRASRPGNCTGHTSMPCSASGAIQPRKLDAAPPAWWKQTSTGPPPATGFA